MATLYATSGAEEGERHALEKPTIIIGRSARCDVRVSDPRASRAHARIRIEGDRYILEDLQGQERGGGTFVNGRAITWHLLVDDDAITIAGTTFRFENVEVEPTERMQLGHMVAGPVSEGDLPIHEAIEAPASPLSVIPSSDGGPTSLAEAHERLRTIYEVANAIGTIFDQAQLIDEILGAIQRVFRQASRVVFLTVDEQTGALFERAEKLRENATVQQKTPISRKIVREVLERKRGVIFGGFNAGSNATKDFTGMLTHSMLCAPLCVRGEVLGVIHLTSKDLITPFVRADLDLLVGIATQAAVALQNAAMHVELLARERLERDVEIAREVQRRFLPMVPPRIQGWSFATEYRPAYAVGGDFYDFIQLGPSRIGVLIGDVAGKGVSAALLMARVTSEFRMLAMTEPATDAVMQRVNLSLVAAGYEGVFVTACYVVLDLEASEISYCNAGHLPPLVRRKATGTVERLEVGGVALGVLDDTQFTQATVELGPGDLVLLMSDGVVESTNAAKEQIGFERIEQVLLHSRGDAESTLDYVMNAIAEFVREASQYDDLTSVCFGREGGGTPRHTLLSPLETGEVGETLYGSR